MKKFLATLLVLALMTVSCVAMAEGVTIRTASMFSATDPSLGVYQELISAYETATGNKVEDASATADETWKATILADFAANNEADVIFYFANTADSVPILDKVVSFDEIRAVYPDYAKDCAPSALAAVTEPDGKVYAAPVRGYWEALFCNKDLFEQYKVELPTDWAKMMTAIETFKANGIVPIALSLSDVPHYMYEHLILSMAGVDGANAKPATVADMPAEWKSALEMLHTLYAAGAFPVDATATTNDLVGNLFREKRAAMQVDGSWYANSIPEAGWDSTIVMNFPIPDGGKGDPKAMIGGFSSGFYITKKAWADEKTRDAAVKFVQQMTTAESIQRLSITIGGELAKTAGEVAANATAVNSPVDSRMSKEAWNVMVQSASGIAEGTLKVDDALAQIFAAKPF